MAWTVKLEFFRSQPARVAGAPPVRTLMLETGGRVGDLAADEAGGPGTDESAEVVAWNCPRTPSLITALRHADVVRYDGQFYRITGHDRPLRTRIIVQGERIR